MSTAWAPVHVLATGITCPVGLTAPTARAAMRAGISRKQELPYHDDRSRPIVGSFLDRLPLSASRVDRLLGLVVPAAKEALAVVPRQRWGQVPLLLVVAEDLGPRHTSDVLRQLVDRLGGGWSPELARAVPEGSFGGINAIAIARAMFVQRRWDSCLVCAVDSFICAAALRSLAREERLLTEDDSDGVIPGEAAACVLLHAYDKTARARVTGLGLARESALLDNDVPLRGDGIVAAARAALLEANRELYDMDVRVSDAAGQSYHFKEQVLLMSRLLRRRKEELPLLLCASALGDTGAAAGLCGIISFIEDVQRRFAPGPRAIAFAGARDGRRAAAVLEVDER